MRLVIISLDFSWIQWLSICGCRQTCIKLSRKSSACHSSMHPIK